MPQIVYCQACGRAFGATGERPKACPTCHRVTEWLSTRPTRVTLPEPICPSCGNEHDLWRRDDLWCCPVCLKTWTALTDAAFLESLHITSER